MLRYGRDYGRWNGQGRYDWERPGGYGHGLGGPRNDSWGVPRNFPSEGAWMGESFGGFGQGYEFDDEPGFESPRGRGPSGGYGNDYYGGGRSGFGNSGWSGQGGDQYGGREGGYREGNMNRGGYGGWEGGRDEGRERGGYRSGGGESGMRAADIMTEEPEAVSPETTLAEVAQKMRDLDVGIIPVVDSAQGRRLRGVVTDRDITIRATAEGKDARNTRVSEVMSSDVETVNKNDRVRDVMEVMRRERVKRVPVTDREGRLVGIIAEADLLLEVDGHQQEHMLEDTLERVYEPSRSRAANRARSARQDRSSGGGSNAGNEGRETGARNENEMRASGKATTRKTAERGGSTTPNE